MLQCVPDDDRWRKHRFRQQASNTLAGILCVAHIALGGVLAWDRCVMGPLLVVFALFGLVMIRDRKVSSNLGMVWCYQLILVVLAGYTAKNCVDELAHLLGVATNHKLEYRGHLTADDDGLAAALPKTREGGGGGAAAPHDAARPIEVSPIRDAMDRNKRIRRAADPPPTPKQLPDDDVPAGRRRSPPQHAPPFAPDMERGDPRRDQVPGREPPPGQRMRPPRPPPPADRDRRPPPPPKGRRRGPPGGQNPGPPPMDPRVPLGTELDLLNPSPEEVRQGHPRLFEDLPPEGFSPDHKNPCWKPKSHFGNRGPDLECLPYAYILGLPKCGSSDLWERLNKHELVLRADRKEVRFFTRGEFSDSAPRDGFLPAAMPLSDFTRHHGQAARSISSARGEDDPVTNAIIVDGGPHTLWWSVQEPDGSWPEGAEGGRDRPKQMPIPLLLRGLQPQARMIVTLAEPVRRMYSDYYFLTSNSVAFDAEGKSPEDFDAIATAQMAEMRRCFRERAVSEGGAEVQDHELLTNLPIRAEQSCAYDRYHFGRPGSGRICIGLYHAFLRRWLEIFPREQFLVLRLEDFNAGPKKYLEHVFDWLGMPETSDANWDTILVDRTYNEHVADRGEILPDTQDRLKQFYAPFNERLSTLLADDRFTWEDVWKSHSQTATAMRSRWGDRGKAPFPFEDPHEGRIPAHHLHDPRFHDKGHIAPPDRRWEQRERDREQFLDRRDRNGELGDGPEPGPGEGRRPPPPPPRPGQGPNGGRDGLISLPEDLIHKDNGGMALCLASMGLHVAAMHRILDTPGVSAKSEIRNDHMRTALHCLGSVFIYGDSLRDSYLFSLLSGDKHWLDRVLDPPPERGHASYGMNHITRGVQAVVKTIAQTLLENGANPNAVDDSGKTPLHYAAIGGLESLAKVLLDAGADPNVVENKHRQTPLHSCATHGNPTVAKLLLDHGARTDLPDQYGNTFLDVATAVGTAINSEDLVNILDLSKVAAKRLPLSSELEATHRHGSGGWNTELLPPKFSKDASYAAEASAPKSSSQYCDLDMVNASRITSDELYERYIMMNRPVLIRGLNVDSPAWQAFKAENLRSEFGDTKVHVSDIPYNNKFGSANGMDSNLLDYIEAMETHTLDGERENHPWYVFKGHPVPEASDRPDSLVNPLAVPIPLLMHELFLKMPDNKAKGPRGPPRDRSQSGLHKIFNRGNQRALEEGNEEEEQRRQEMIREQVNRRRPFVNLQWALGTAGSGAPVHFHNTAWNQLFYGRKHWYLFPPSKNLMGKKQVMDWLEHDMKGLIDDGFSPMECVQLQGDVLIVPELWGHAVLNVQDSVAVASEVRGSSFRLDLPKVYRDLSGHPHPARDRGRKPNRPPPPKRDRGENDWQPV